MTDTIIVLTMIILLPIAMDLDRLLNEVYRVPSFSRTCTIAIVVIILELFLAWLLVG